VCGCAMDTDAMVDPCAFAGCPSARGFEHFMLELYPNPEFRVAVAFR
jgi:hypothetical protein